jgi:hypothetical protein
MEVAYNKDGTIVTVYPEWTPTQREFYQPG